MRSDKPLNDFINLNTLVTLNTLNIRAIWGPTDKALEELVPRLVIAMSPIDNNTNTKSNWLDS